MRLALFGIVTACCAGIANAQDVAAGRAVYEWICMACHGPEAEGQGALQAPSLRMQQDWYLQGQLQKFRDGIRGAHPADTTGAPMQLTATGLDDKKIADVTAYIVSLGAKGLPASQHALVGDPNNGQLLYAACASCHGPDARGNPALRAPSLAGQWDWYIARQLGKFKARIRGGDPRDVYGAQMAPFAAMLADEAAIRDISVYIRSLPAPQTAVAPTEPDLANGAKAFTLCASCHGDQAEGNGTFHAPYLAGQSTWYIVRQLHNFRRGVRGSEPIDVFGTQMRALMTNVADDTIIDLAGHIAAMSPPPRREPTPGFGGDLALGERIFTKTCAPCHGLEAQGNRVLSAPSLAGQEDRYIARQLSDFRAGLRGADLRDPPGRIMRAWAASLANDEEIRSVAAYVASLEPLTAHEAESVIAAMEPNDRAATPMGPNPASPPAWPKGLLSPDANAPVAHEKPDPVTAKPVMAEPSDGNIATTSEPTPDEAPTGETIFSTCVGCHGIEGQGNPTLRAPALAGLGDWYVAEQLRKFRAGWRGTHPMDAGGSSMRPMASTLIDEQAILEVAGHIAGLPFDTLPPITGSGDAVRGGAIYVACSGCHGTDARGNAALKAPALANQADWYLATQLRNFKAGARGAHPADTAGAMMRPMAGSLADEAAIQDVVAYIVALRRGEAATPVATTSASQPADAAPLEPEPEPEPDSEPDSETAPEAAALAGDAGHGQALFMTCIACHGIDGAGNAALKAPALAGQEHWYLATQLRNFKAGIRGAHPGDTTGALMRPMAMTLADEQAILDVAAYAAGLVASTAATATLDGDANRGKMLYNTCIACHGLDARGNAALKAPALAGQEDWYLATQLKNFRAGVRGAHQDDTAGALMRPMAATLADEQAIFDVAAFLTSLQRGPEVR